MSSNGDASGAERWPLALDDTARSLFDEAPVAMVLADEAGVLLGANAAFAEFIGHPSAVLVGRNIAELSVGEDGAPATALLHEAPADGSVQTVLEKRYVRADGSIVNGMLVLQSVRSALGQRLLVGHVLDIHALKLAERKLQHDALHDQLTTLPNRALFLDRVGQQQLREQPGAVLVVGLDRFANVNEGFGHVEGDAILSEVGRRLRELFDARVTVARLGGDEFALLLDATEADAAVHTIRGAVSQPFASAEGHGEHGEVRLTASIGIRHVYPGEPPSSLLRDATTALHRAKELGRDRAVTFRGTMRTKMSRAIGVEHALRHALDKRQMVVLYQQIRSARNGALVGFEALVRMADTLYGPVSPVEFIPIAESDGLILPLGLVVLEHALGQLRAWNVPSLGAPYVSVNLSSVQVRDLEHVNLLAQRIRESGVAPGRLRFELTESVFLNPSADVRDALARLRDTGAQLVLDDFGVGYSSLSYLRTLPLDGLKIDRAFVQQAETDERSRRLVDAIITLARSLDMYSVAEGVETETQRRMLTTAGVDYLQGYLFARPVPASQALGPAAPRV